MSEDTSEVLKPMREERSRAADAVQLILAKIGAQTGDTLSITFNNGIGKKAILNGWMETESGARYLKLDTASVPPIYIADIKKADS